MIDPMPRKDVELPPRMPEAAIIAELRAENARLRANAAAAVAAAVEQAAEIAEKHYGCLMGAPPALLSAVRALAPGAGTAELAEWKRLAIVGNLAALEMRVVEGDRDRLTADLAAAQAKIEALRGAVTEYHLALDLRQNGDTAGDRLQDKVQRILDMPWRQGAALAALPAKEGE